MPRPERRLPRYRAMITAPQPEAVDAGATVLREGGNALDAALACAFVQGVVDPLMTGIGGFGVLHVYDAASGRHLVLNGLGGCPKASTPEMWADRYLGETSDGFGFILRDFVNEAGAQAVAAPGILDVFAKAHAELGRVAWADLFGPAIGYARKGWVIRPHVYTVFTQDERRYGRMNYGEKLSVSPDGRRLYLDDTGEMKRPGARVENPDLARTLETVARDGAETFYRGSLARHIAAELARHGGLLSEADLAGFEAERAEPLMADYRGRTLATVAPPAGGLYLAQALRILERFDLPSLGHNSPDYIRVLVEAMKIAARDRETRTADPRFVPTPTEELLAESYAEACAGKIRRGEKTDLPRGGMAESKHTTHVSAVDGDGMVVSLTHTLGNPSGFIPEGTGMVLNGAMASFDPRPGRTGSIAPGKRRTSTMCPSILFDEGRAVMTVGAPGASWIGPAVLQVILNVLEFGMTMQEAISAPRAVATSNAIDISNRIPREAERALAGMGYEVRRSHLSYAFAGVHGIAMWDGVLDGGADPGRDGMAMGVE